MILKIICCGTGPTPLVQMADWIHGDNPNRMREREGQIQSTMVGSPNSSEGNQLRFPHGENRATVDTPFVSTKTTRPGTRRHDNSGCTVESRFHCRRAGAWAKGMYSPIITTRGLLENYLILIYIYNSLHIYIYYIYISILFYIYFYRLFSLIFPFKPLSAGYFPLPLSKYRIFHRFKGFQRAL